MTRWLLIAVAIIAAASILFLQGQGQLSEVQSDAVLKSESALQHAIKQTQSAAGNSLYGAQLTVTSGTNSWSATQTTLESSGNDGVDFTYGGAGTVTLGGGTGANTFTITATPNGALSATQGSVALSCPFTFTVDGGSMTYVC